MVQGGGVPFQSRHYLAIMAASRHKCSYLVNQQEHEFKLENQDINWLQGIEYAHPKLKKLNELNKLLCHRPWLITPHHLEKLLNSKTDNWEKNQLLMAVAILTNFHALSGFVFGTGINSKHLEIEHRQQQQKQHQQHLQQQQQQQQLQFEIMNSYYEDDDDEDNGDNDDNDDDYDNTNFTYDDDFNNKNNDNGRTSRFSDSKGATTFTIEVHPNNQKKISQNNLLNRSNSSGSINRTLSNSSASSCEQGFDIVLKEMKIIQCDNNNNNLNNINRNHIQGQKSIPITNKSHCCNSRSYSNPNSQQNTPSINGFFASDFNSPNSNHHSHYNHSFATKNESRSVVNSCLNDVSNSSKGISNGSNGSIGVQSPKMNNSHSYLYHPYNTSNGYIGHHLKNESENDLPSDEAVLGAVFNSNCECNSNKNRTEPQTISYNNNNNTNSFINNSINDDNSKYLLKNCVNNNDTNNSADRLINNNNNSINKSSSSSSDITDDLILKKQLINTTTNNDNNGEESSLDGEVASGAALDAAQDDYLRRYILDHDFGYRKFNGATDEHLRLEVIF
jgi:hypothetical protein